MSSSSVGVRKNSSLSRGIKIRGVAFSRCRISTYNSRGRDTGLVEAGVEDRKECEFRELLGRRMGGDSCCIRELHHRVWICVPLNETCWLCARSGVLMRLRAAEDLRGAVCCFGAEIFYCEAFCIGFEREDVDADGGILFLEERVCLV